MSQTNNTQVKTVLQMLKENRAQFAALRAELKTLNAMRKEEFVAPQEPINIEEIIRELTASTTRQDAQSFLDAKYSNKKQLELIARRLDIPIIRQDKVEFLRDKIIEATVGARLRSQAIRGTGA